MKKRNEKGFFLVETMLVISIVAVVLLIVFKLFTSVYYGFLESENYNTVNAINALSNIQKYYESIGEIDTSLLSETNTYIELTNDEKYSSPYYTRIKEEYGITDVYLIDLDYFLNSNNVSNFPVLFRRYLKTLKNVEGIALVICTNGSEFSYVKLEDSVHIKLNGDEEDEYGVYINVGGTFTDPGYTGWDGNAPQTEWENGKVLDTNTPGTYYLHYNFDGYLFRRKVEVGNYNASFSYTGSEQEYVVNAPGYYKIEAWGAQGGSYNSTYLGAFGGYTGAIIKLNKGDVMYVYVGGTGSLGYSASSSATANGGYNGGATIVTEGSNGYSTSGGGATDIRYFGQIVPTSEELVWNSNLGLNSRIIVAGGGGGTDTNPNNSYVGYGGKGGMLVADPGTTNQSSKYFGGGGSQSSGGVNSKNSSHSGLFGMSTSSSLTTNAGGGGGGYYGGGSGYGYRSGGGGGSSFISGYAGVNAITSSTDRTHTNNTLHYSNKYFINGKMESGVNEGDGKVKITYLGPDYSKTNTRLNNTRYIKDCVNGNSKNTTNNWTELQAIFEGLNVAKGKSITGTSTQNSSYPYSRITDGDITYSKYAQAGTSGSLQCVVVDLENTYDLDEIAVWHYYGDTRSYKNHSLYVSSDNTTWTTLIDNVSGVTETANGIRVSAYE